MDRWILTFGLFFALLTATAGHLNLFLNLYEVMRLLGVSAELYYVRDGMINDYALNFVVPIPPSMQEITFTWQSLTKKPLPYSITITTSDPELLPRPALNISRIGEIPTHIETFSVGMKCSGKRDAYVNVDIRVEIIIDKAKNNVTDLLFKRRKVCRASTTTEPPFMPLPDPPAPVDVEPEKELDDPLHPDPIPPRNELTSLMIGGILALILISILISIVFCGKSSSKQPQPNIAPLVKTSSFQHLQNPANYALKSIYSTPSDAIISSNGFGTHPRDMTCGNGFSASNSLLNNHRNNTINNHPMHQSSLFSESMHYSSGTLGSYLRPPIRLPTTGHYNQCSDFGDSYYMSIDERI